MTILLSFDIDGTMEFGDPPGPVAAEIVRRAQEMGYTVGSCSDRPAPVQAMLFAAKGITLDFSVIKHQLPLVKARFEAEIYYHIGDRELDKQFAEQAGFDFFYPDVAITEPWNN